MRMIIILSLKAMKIFKNIKLSPLILLIVLGSEQIFASEVNLYTSRHYDTDDELYERFTEKTGIKVNVLSAKGNALIEKIRSEGDRSPADVFVTVDAGNLWKLQKDGFFQSIKSPVIKKTVPERLRGPNDEWVGLAKRARVIFYNPNSVSKTELKNLSYEDLSEQKWIGRIVIRSSNNLYNQSLVASLIAHNGIEETEKWGKAFVNNFARKPQGNDRAQIIAVANGEADIAIANSYYIGLMLSGKKGEDQKIAAEKVGMYFPNQNGRGTHINISGAGILKSSKNTKNSEKFIEFLLSEIAQNHIVNNTYEYPVLSGVKSNKNISKFGENFKEDELSVSNYGKFNPEAVKLMDRIGWK